MPFKAMRFNRGVIVGGPFLFIAISMVFFAAAMWLVFTDPQLQLTNPTTSLSGIEGQTVAVLVLTAVALIAADVFSSAVVAPGFARAVLGERIKLGEALAIVRSKAWSILGLYGLMLLAGLLSIAPGGLLVFSGATADDSTSVVVGVFLIAILVIPVGVVVGVVGGIARAVVVLERKGPIQAVKRAWQVIKGRFWWSVLIVFVTSLIVNFAASLVQQVGSVIGFVGLALAPDNPTLGLLVSVAATVLFTLITYVIVYAYLGAVYTLLYVDARIRHEGFDHDLARAAEARHAG